MTTLGKRALGSKLALYILPIETVGWVVRGFELGHQLPLAEDLQRLLESLVLGDRENHGCRPAGPRDHHVLVA